MPAEREAGNAIFSKIREIVSLCVDNGEFKYVRRTDLTPIVEQNGVELSLDKLSSGNLFLVEQLLLLLLKMYSVSVVAGLSASEAFNLPGVVLIDEIETHLHPVWQKRIVGIIRNLFPRLQLIITTHSPFVVASVDGARIYTAKPASGYSTLADETEKYGHMPVDEILASDLFGVLPFNDHISDLLKEREKCISSGDIQRKREIEKTLYSINPPVFLLSWIRPTASSAINQNYRMRHIDRLPEPEILVRKKKA